MCLPTLVRGSRLEIIAAIVAVEYALGPGEPFAALPNVPFSHTCLDDRYPPVIKQEDEKADYPFDKDPENIIKTEEHGPETAVLAALV